MVDLQDLDYKKCLKLHALILLRCQFSSGVVNSIDKTKTNFLFHIAYVTLCKNSIIASIQIQFLLPTSFSPCVKLHTKKMKLASQTINILGR